jgi:Gpi18-like mannosyltransferase
METMRQYSEPVSNFLEENKWLVISSILNMLLQVIVAIIYFNPIDFVLQVETARQIAQGNLLYRDINQIVYNGFVLPNPQYPPLYLYTLAALIFIVGTEIFTFNMAKLLLIFVNFFVAFQIYHLINTNYSKKYALLAFNWFLLNPSTLGVILGGYHENYMLLFILLAFLCFTQEKMILSGICFGLALLVKPIAGVYMFPILIWGLKERRVASIQIGFVAGLTFTLVSLPFLLLAPTEFITDVFLIHTNRLDPSMSFYVYIFTELSPSLIPFVVQILLFSVIGVISYYYLEFKDPIDIYVGVLPFATIFLAFNRILYPHYIPMIFPFFTIMLFYLIDRYQLGTKKEATLRQIWTIILGLGAVYAGYIWWSILWLIEGYETHQSNVFFPISAAICIGGLIMITLVSLWSIATTKNMKERRESLV